MAWSLVKHRDNFTFFNLLYYTSSIRMIRPNSSRDDVGHNSG